MRRKRLYGVWLIITALLIMQLPVSQSVAATSTSDFKMEGTTLVKYRGTEESVSVPGIVEVIGRSAFEGNEYVKTVIIPASVKKIEPYAFWDCDSLKTIVLGKGLTEVGDFAFAGCKGLAGISIPSGVRSIGIQSFADCVNMTDITIPSTVTDIHKTAFDGCYKLVIHCEAGSYAEQYAEEFYERQLEMPEYEDVADYEDEGEEDEEDADIVDSSNASFGLSKVVGNNAVIFVDNSDMTVYDGKGNKIGEGGTSVEDNSMSLDVVEPEDNEVSKYTIVDDKIVSDQAYYRNQKLNNVVLPDGITEIGQFAFARSSVTSITIPDGVRTIGYGAFYHCDDLKSVSLPDSITTIEPKAFLYTEWVESFLESGTEDYLVSGDILIAYRGTEDYVEIPDGVRLIAAEAFAGHTEIKRVIMSDELEIIGEGAFEGCTNLKKLLWGKKATTIKDRAFADCNLSEVKIPSTVKNLGVGAFDDDVSLVTEDETIFVRTHETSAERLSNEEYRRLDENAETGEIGVTIKGSDAVTARLEGAARSYTLEALETSTYSALKTAYKRSYDKELPSDIVVYNLTLTDSSDIPITKLGKQALVVSIQLPESMRNQQVRVVTLDRNGQLEYIDSERVLVNNREAVRFKTYHLSMFGVYGTGKDLDDEELLEETNDLQALSRGVAEDESLSESNVRVTVKYGVSAVVLVLGVVLLVSKKKTI